MVRLLGEERFRDKQREVGIHVARIFEHFVEGIVHFFPDGVAIGFDNHTSADGGVFGQPGFDNQVIVPFAVIVLARGEVFELFSHEFTSIYRRQR